MVQRQHFAEYVMQKVKDCVNEHTWPFSAAMMAIRVLLDHDIPEENITLVSLLMAESGVHTIAYAFPKVLYIFYLPHPQSLH